MTAISRVSWSAVPLLGATAGGLLAGGLLAHLHRVLPGEWGAVADPGAVWALITAVVATRVPPHRGTAMACGVLALFGEVTGYFTYVTDLAGVPVLQSEMLLWTLAALWIGPVAGRVAYGVRWGRRAHQLVAVLALCGVVAGQGTHLWRLGGVPIAGVLEMALGAVVAIAALVRIRAGARWRIAAVAGALLVAAVVQLAYAQPLFS